MMPKRRLVLAVAVGALVAGLGVAAAFATNPRSTPAQGLNATGTTTTSGQQPSEEQQAADDVAEAADDVQSEADNGSAVVPGQPQTTSPTQPQTTTQTTSDQGDNNDDQGDDNDDQGDNGSGD